MRLDLLTATLAGVMINHGITVIASGLVFAGIVFIAVGFGCYIAAGNL